MKSNVFAISVKIVVINFCLKSMTAFLSLCGRGVFVKQITERILEIKSCSCRISPEERCVFE